jgi:hypothetical protein
LAGLKMRGVAEVFKCEEARKKPDDGFN